MFVYVKIKTVTIQVTTVHFKGIKIEYNLTRSNYMRESDYDRLC